MHASGQRRLMSSIFISMSCFISFIFIFMSCFMSPIFRKACLLTEAERGQQVPTEPAPMGNQVPSEHIAQDAPVGNQRPVELTAVGQVALRAPLCKGHQEPCVKKRVNKSGPNKGQQLSIAAVRQNTDNCCEGRQHLHSM